MTRHVDSAPLQPPRHLWLPLVLGGAPLWLITIVYSYLRPSFWVFDLYVVPLAWVCFLAGIGCIAWGVIRSRSLLVTALVIPLVLVISVLVGAWWQVSPRGWFTVHRAMYNAALATDPGSHYDGNPLPPHLRFLSADGRVSGSRDGIRFFPQWIGVPDDAGGFLYSPSGSPEGYDMYGMQCRGPVALGGGWWMCGMRD